MVSQRENGGSLTRPLDITGDFPDQGFQLWREAAAKSLKGKSIDRLVTKTHEGLLIDPVYGQETANKTSSFPGQAPFTRGNSPLGNTDWRSGFMLDHLGSQTAAERLKQALNLNLNAILLHLEGGTTVADLKVVLAEIADADITVHLAGGNPSFANAATLIAALRSDSRHTAQHTLGCDPLGALADGATLMPGIDLQLEQMAAIAAWTAANAPQLRPIAISSLPYHLAGATAVEELAFSAATAIAYLRALAAAGISIKDLPELHLVFGIGRDAFMEVAKLRAARAVFSHVLQSCGVASENSGISIEAITSERTMTQRDPWVNLLRVTVETFAASIGGANTITTLPFDWAIGEPSAQANRLAANTSTILREESHLARVIDPAGGSFYVEKLTSDLSQAAWSLIQHIESEGGMTSFLRSGKAQALVREKANARDRAINNRKDPITGVSSYANLGEEKIERTSPEATATPSPSEHQDHNTTENLDELIRLLKERGWVPEVFAAAITAMQGGAAISIDQLHSALTPKDAATTTIEPFTAHREAERFEALRDLSDQYHDVSGADPTVFLANLGAIPDFKARASFATNFLEAAGIRAIDNNGFSTAAQAAEGFLASSATIALICSSDAIYAEMAAATAVALKTAGATHVMLAGRPGEHEEAWREAGIDTFIYIGCDVLHSLTDLLCQLGVQHG